MAKRKEVAGEAHKSKPLRVLELGAPRRKYTRKVTEQPVEQPNEVPSFLTSASDESEGS